MPRSAFLLRGVNVGGKHRLPMARLRELAGEVGLADAATYVQSGNLAAKAEDVGGAAAALASALEADLGFAVPVVARTYAELAAVVAANPFGDRAPDPARHSVVFLDDPPDDEAFADLDRAAFLPDEVAVDGREVHLWTPDGQHASKLLRAVTTRLRGEGTARNRRTVERLLAMTA